VLPAYANPGKKQDCNWLHFAIRTGPEAREWAEGYQRHFDKLELGTSALTHFREGHLESGEGLLREFIDQVEGVPATEPASLRAVLDRFRYGIEGYYFYCKREFAPAQHSMRLAHDAVARALSTADWLLLLAVQCQEFLMHQARIARNEHRWPRMQACISQARAMMSDRSPLCETEDGKKIWWSSFQPFFDALEPLTAEETRYARTLMDPQERERLFDQFVRSMLRSSTNNGKYQ
jgi:hypothetical protein